MYIYTSIYIASGSASRNKNSGCTPASNVYRKFIFIKKISLHTKDFGTEACLNHISIKAKFLPTGIVSRVSLPSFNWLSYTLVTVQSSVNYFPLLNLLTKFVEIEFYSWGYETIPNVSYPNSTVYFLYPQNTIIFAVIFLFFYMLSSKYLSF